MGVFLHMSHKSFSHDPSASLGASQFIQMLALSSALSVCFLLAHRVAFYANRYGSRWWAWHKVLHISFALDGYSPFYYAIPQLHYVCATLAVPHFAAAAAFATLRIYYKFLHTIYCLSVPPARGQAGRGGELGEAWACLCVGAKGFLLPARRGLAFKPRIKCHTGFY